jgi:hypothetical protein
MIGEPDEGVIARGNITYFPVVPGRLEFAARLRAYILAKHPDVIALELPSSLEETYTAALERMPQMSVIVIPETDEGIEEGQATYIPIEPADAFVEGMRSAQETGAELLFLEPATHNRPHLAQSYPDPYALEKIGLSEYVKVYREQSDSSSEEMEQHAAAMAWKLQGSDPFASVLVVVSLNLLDALLDAMESPQDEPASERASLFHRAELFNLHPDCLAEVTSEIPYYQDLYELARTSGETGPMVDRPRWQLRLLRDAETEYVINTGDKIVSWQRKATGKFARNLALLDGALLPQLYDLTLASRSVVDDNFAYEVWQMGNRYNVQQTDDPPLETLNLSGEEVWLNTRKLRIRRRLPRMKQRWKPAQLKERKREKTPGEWARETDGASICSYPPEDIVIENYGRFLKHYAKAIVSEERSRVEPFSTSMLDGLDIRETIRHWHDRKLFVREMGKFAGDTGAVVIIFDEDRENRCNYLTTWLGEHRNESDMAFYATHPFDHLVGPGIGRAEYGGLLMTLPPRRLYDVWSDPDYEMAETKSERLLMAAIDYSVEQHILYVAAKPPRSTFRRMAALLNRKIVYIPLGQLSPAKLKRIRVVHVLDSYARREVAKDYIW